MGYTDRHYDWTGTGQIQEPEAAEAEGRGYREPPASVDDHLRSL